MIRTGDTIRTWSYMHDEWTYAEASPYIHHFIGHSRIELIRKESDYESKEEQKLHINVLNRLS